MTVEILEGDCRDVLARLPDGQFHAVVTSPPYWGLRDYGLDPLIWGGDDGCEHQWGEPLNGCSQSGSLAGSTLGGAPPGAERRPMWTSAFCRRCKAWRGALGQEPTPELYVEHIVMAFREVRRVLRDDGVMWLNVGDGYARRARPHTTRWQHGLEGKDAGRALGGASLKPKDLLMMPARVALALQAEGWWLRSDIIWSKPNPMPESATDRPTLSHEHVFLLAKSGRSQFWTNSVTGEGSRTEPRKLGRWEEGTDWEWGTRAGKRIRLSLWDGHDYFYDADAVREPLAEASIARISQPAFDQQQGGPKDSGKTDINQNRSARKALEGLAASQRNDNPAGRNKRSVWAIATQPFPGAHFAVFPEKLVEPCIQAGSSERGCCPECGAPWGREVEKGELREHPDREGRSVRNVAFDGDGYAETSGTLGLTRDSRTIGWRPTCAHEGEPVPCRILDCFAGSGTVGVVAERLGRHSTLIEMNPDYVALARARTAQLGLVSA